MDAKIDNIEFAEAAYKYKDSHIPYSKYDCQAFVEKVLRDCGIKHNWRGSNHMWRDALDWKGTISECIAEWGGVPPGAWVFHVKHDGGERKHGYNDNEGNASHVGIFCGPDLGVMHSTKGGVQLGPWPDEKRWTHVGLCKYIEYATQNTSDIIDMIDTCIEALETLKRRLLDNDLRPDSEPAQSGIYAG